MSGIGQGGRFTGTTSGHVHPETPKVWYGEALPTQGMRRGDLFIRTVPALLMARDYPPVLHNEDRPQEAQG